MVHHQQILNHRIGCIHKHHQDHHHHIIINMDPVFMNQDHIIDISVKDLMEEDESFELYICLNKRNSRQALRIRMDGWMNGWVVQYQEEMVWFGWLGLLRILFFFFPFPFPRFQCTNSLMNLFFLSRGVCRYHIRFN